MLNKWLCYIIVSITAISSIYFICVLITLPLKAFHFYSLLAKCFIFPQCSYTINLKRGKLAVEIIVVVVVTCMLKLIYLPIVTLPTTTKITTIEHQESIWKVVTSTIGARSKNSKRKQTTELKHLTKLKRWWGCWQLTMVNAWLKRKQFFWFCKSTGKLRIT